MLPFISVAVAVAVFNEQCLALGKSCMSNIRRQMQNQRFHLQRRINCRTDMVSNLVTYTARCLLSGGLNEIQVHAVRYKEKFVYMGPCIVNQI